MTGDDDVDADDDDNDDNDDHVYISSRTPSAF